MTRHLHLRTPVPPMTDSLITSPNRAGLRAVACSIALAALLAGAPLAATDSPQFRGPERDGIFHADGLAKSWPEGGPKLLWSASGLGESYASMAVADGKIYTTGKHEDAGTAFAFDLQGKKLWSTVYGKEHAGGGYPGSRSTPTFDDGMLFVLSSTGEAVALDADDGTIRWKVNVLERFKGENIYFGVSESPLVDGNRVILTPGGKDAAVVALDKKTGDTVWTSKGLSEKAAYCNPRIWDTGTHRQLVTMTAKHMVGLDPESGAILWRTEMPAEYDIHATSPVWTDTGKGNLIYVSHGYKQGGKAYRLADDGRSVTPAWTEEKLDIHHGGAVLLDGHIYGAASGKTWYALDAETGEILASIPRLGKGAVVYADGHLYGYVESGEVLLVNPDPKAFEVVSRFEITAGEGHHWSHPVIAGKVLYIRHGDVLMAYDIAASG